MRVSSSLVFQTGLNTINKQQSDLMHLYQQIGTGQKMVTPADDPLGASQAINLSQSQAQNVRYADNRAVANQNLGTEEDALSSLTLLLQDVRTRLVEIGNGTLSDADRGTLAGILRQAQATALGIANTTDGNGQYLFSGSRGDIPAYDANGNYDGDSLQRLIQADQTRRIAGGDVGSDVFQRAQPGTRDYLSAADAGNNGTAILGRAAIADYAQGNADAKFSFDIQFDATGNNYTVTATALAADPAATPPIAVGDVVTTTHAWTPGQKSLDLGVGTTLEINGEPAANDQFTAEPLKHSTGLNLFQAMGALADALEQPIQGDQTASTSLRNLMNTTSQTLATLYDNVLTVRASVGSRMNELTALNNTGAQRNLGYAAALSGIEDLDYYEATTQLSLRKMALEGAGLAFQTIQGLSLFNRGK
ncbi:flagellar hook-associated protein FlgL [Castellaniella hirudinis]|uniref:Flagellar hook-associated protein FlgL n=1 Tax=Castellaniella hirudinis TaxID=1144617 RepID=A0ABV8RYS2_9BURK